VPDPLGDQTQAWYYWRSQQFINVANTPQTSALMWEFDIRTSRRVRGGFRLAWVSESLGGAGVYSGLILSVSIRTLWRLD